jgi:23S rRNA pseudouridine2605 synthase
MGKEKISPKDKTPKKATGSGVWEIKSKSGSRGERDGQQPPRRRSSDRPERDSQERPRRRSTSPERESAYERREQKPRRTSSGRPERDSRERPNKYSPDRASQRTRRSVGTDTDRSQEKKPVQKKDELVRLNKFIANSGICSRREADEYIVAGLVSVNGQIVTELGTKVRKDDDIRFNKERLKGENKAYVILNKPKNYITTTDDPHAKKTVMELIEGACKERVYPVGRLDRNSTGVLLFTNDGDLAKQLTHPSYNKLKVYQVRLDRNIVKADVKALVEGVELDDGQAIADNVHVSETNKAEVGIEIHSGRNRVIRRMFEKLGYDVVKLDRVYFAGLTKKGLRRGQYRLLTPKEVEMLKMGAYE